MVKPVQPFYAFTREQLTEIATSCRQAARLDTFSKAVCLPFHPAIETSPLFQANRSYHFWNSGIVAAWGLIDKPDKLREINVAIIDDGFIPNAELSPEQVRPGYDILDQDTSAEVPSEVQYNVHGTRMADLITGSNGVAPGVGIIPIRAFHMQHPLKMMLTGTIFRHGNLADSINAAVNAGADVINMSFGMESVSTADMEAITWARQLGVILVAGTGNDADRVGFPAWHPDVIAVGSATERGIASLLWSTRDGVGNSTDRYFLSPYTSVGPSIDLLAPGGEKAFYNYTVTHSGSIWHSNVAEHHAPASATSGTSNSAALVSGAVALLLAEGCPPDYVQDVLKLTATPLHDERAHGAGMINLGAAVLMAHIIRDSLQAAPPTNPDSVAVPFHATDVGIN